MIYLRKLQSNFPKSFCFREIRKIVVVVVVVAVVVGWVKSEMTYLLRSRREILPRSGAFSNRSGRKTASHIRTEIIF